MYKVFYGSLEYEGVHLIGFTLIRLRGKQRKQFL